MEQLTQELTALWRPVVALVLFLVALGARLQALSEQGRAIARIEGTLAGLVEWKGKMERRCAALTGKLD